MSSNIKSFNFGPRSVRVIDRAGSPWWVASDVCECLGVSNNRKAVSRLDDDEKDGVTSSDTIGRNQEMIVINESGLYSLVLSSKKPEAKAFKKWITSEVLPSLRKTGTYTAPDATAPRPTPEELAAEIMAGALRAQLGAPTPFIPDVEDIEREGIVHVHPHAHAPSGARPGRCPWCAGEVLWVSYPHAGLSHRWVAVGVARQMVCLPMGGGWSWAWVPHLPSCAAFVVARHAGAVPRSQAALVSSSNRLR